MHKHPFVKSLREIHFSSSIRLGPSASNPDFCGGKSPGTFINLVSSFCPAVELGMIQDFAWPGRLASLIQQVPCQSNTSHPRALLFVIGRSDRMLCTRVVKGSKWAAGLVETFCSRSLPGAAGLDACMPSGNRPIRLPAASHVDLGLNANLYTYRINNPLIRSSSSRKSD